MKQIIRFWFASGVALCCLVASSSVQAQIVPDTTLPSNSQVISQGKISIINGGSRAGGNLFHSFSQFSVPTLGVAYFNNALDIQNIISRVTGSSISSIDGLIRANGTANLFLLNPNGIIFGPNAQLRIGGSFVASTARSLKLADGSSFSAKTPETKPLLTVSVPIGLQYGASPGSIINQSQVANSSGTLIGLQVQPGKTLALVGGDVSLDGGGLTASGGRVELGGLAGAGTVGLGINGNTFSFSFTPDSSLANVILTNDARVSVRGTGGGNIVVNANAFNATNGGRLVAGTGGQGNGGDITVNANNFSISGVGLSENGSGIYNEATTNASGNGGNITIKAESLSITDNAVLSTSTSGQGNAGSIFVQANGPVSLAYSTIGSNVMSGAVGNGGGISITSGSLSLTDEAQLSASTFGQGNAGSVFVQANGPVSLANGNIINNVESGAVGNAGGIFITAGSLSLTNGAQLQSGIHEASGTLAGGRGNGGDVNINTRDAVTIAGANSVGNQSAILNTVEAGAVGNGGNITIKAGSFSLTDNAELSTSTSGQGNAGSVFVQANGLVSLAYSAIGSSVNRGAVGKGGEISITSGSLSITDEAQLATDTLGQGNAGRVFVQANGLVFLANSNIISDVQHGGVGNAGDIFITAGSLSLTNGAQLQSSIRRASDTLPGGLGNSGNVNINVRDAVTIAGANSSGNSSAIFGEVEDGAIGNGGNIRIKAEMLSLSNGAQVVTSTSGQGNAGSVFVQANGDVFLIGNKTSIFSDVQPGAVGSGGDINITARSLSLTNGAGMSSSTFGQGDAGNVNINARNAVTATGNNSAFASFVSGEARGKGGDINISTGSLSLTNGAELLASTSGQGDAGNIRINARDLVTFDGVDSNGASSGAFSTANSGAVGKGGDINIDPNRLTISNGAGVVVDSQGSGRGGNLNVQADYLTLDNNASLSATATSAEGGNIALNVPSLLLMRHNSRISATAGITGGSGNGGNIGINTKFLAAFPSENSDITANAFSGNGGKIQITAQGIFGIASQPRNTPQSDITASSTLGINGTVQINTLVIDPSRGLGVLPAQIVDASRLIAQSCPATGGQAPSKFVVTGHGGLPPTPSHALTTDAVLTNWASLEHDENSSGPAHANNHAPESEPTQIIEAQGWVIGAHGEVILTAQSTNLTSNSPGLKPAACHGV